MKDLNNINFNNKKISEGMYYDGRPLLSFNKNLNIVISSRGTGKTYFYKRWAVKKSLNSIISSYNKHGEVRPEDVKQFIIIRRYKKELSINNISKFTDDIKEAFSDYILEIKKKSIFIQDKEKIMMEEPIEIGFFYALTEQTYIRSTPFKNVIITIFDEAIMNNGAGGLRYIKDEPIVYGEVLSTINRNRKGVRHIILGNAIKLADWPFMEAFKFDLDPSDMFKKEFYNCKNSDSVILQMYKSKSEFRDDLIESDIGKIFRNVKGFGDYLIEGTQLKDNSNAFILPPDLFKKQIKKSKIIASFNIDGEQIGLWQVNGTGQLIFRKAAGGVDYKNRFTLNEEDRTLDTKGIQVFKKSSIYNILKIYDSHNGVFYEDPFIYEKAKKLFFI